MSRQGGAAALDRPAAADAGVVLEQQSLAWALTALPRALWRPAAPAFSHRAGAAAAHAKASEPAANRAAGISFMRVYCSAQLSSFYFLVPARLI